MLSFKIIFLIAYPILLIGLYWIFLVLAKRLHNQNLEKLGVGSKGVLDENFKRMMRYIKISLVSLFMTSVIFLFIIL